MKKTYLMAILLIILFLAVGCAKNNIQDHKAAPIQIKISQNSAEDTYKPSETWFNAKITVDGSNGTGEINELIYGNNGWIDNMKLKFPALPTKNKAEFYNEQIDKFYYYFDVIKEMKPTIIRLPGGLQANHEDWKKIIGDFEKRPKGSESGVEQVVVAGIDEYTASTKNIGSEIIYTVNFADSPEKSAELAKYLKGTAKYYEIGNELNCGMKKNDVLTRKIAEEYAKKLAAISDAMKSADPEIKIGSIDDCNKFGKDWYDTVDKIAGDKFDFWAKHAYSPGSDGDVKGVTINNAKLPLKTKHDFKYDGNYELVFLAEGKKQFNNIPGFDVLIDGSRIGSITIDEFSGIFKNEPAAKFYRLNTNIKKGRHYFEIVSSDAVENNAFLVLHPIIKITNNGKDDAIDLRNDENIMKLITSGAVAVGKKLEEDKSLFHNKPVFITEWNTIYSFDECSKDGILADEKIMCSRNDGMREAINTADYYNMFIDEQSIVKEANFWLLFTEIGNMEIKDREIKINPSYYVAKMYSNNIAGQKLKIYVESPSYTVGYDTGLTMGIVSKNMEIPYISVIAAKKSNKIAIAIINKHPSQDAQVVLNLENVDVADKALLYQIYSNNLNDNEVIIKESPIYSAREFGVMLPRHSINVIELELV